MEGKRRRVVHLDVPPARATGEVPGRTVEGNGVLPLFLIRSKDDVRLLRVADIDWIRAEGNYTCIRTGNVEYLVRRGISEIERRLAHTSLLRISRSAIVNLERVERLIPWLRGGYRVRLTTGAEFKLTSRYAERMFVLLGRPL